MAKQPTLPLYYNDIGRTCSTWTDEEFGCYMRLLMEQWDKGHIPKDPKRLARLVTSLEKNGHIIKEKFVEVDGVLKNERMEEVRAKTLIHKQKQKENVERRYKKLPNAYQTSTKQDTKNLPLEDENENDIETIPLIRGIQHFQQLNEFYAKDYSEQAEPFKSKFTERQYACFQIILTKMFAEYPEVKTSFDRCMNIGDWLLHLEGKPYAQIREGIGVMLAYKIEPTVNMAIKIKQFQKKEKEQGNEQNTPKAGRHTAGDIERFING